MKKGFNLKLEYSLFLMAFLLLNAFIISCTNNESGQEDAAKDITEVKVTLPPGEGLELVEANCVPCHSLRYIEMQPDMTRKNWEKIVTKMIKNFGAPIKDTLISNQIVEYLVAVKGQK